MTKQEAIHHLEQEIKKLKEQQDEYGEVCQKFSNLDTQLKARKAKGEEFTKDSPDVIRLMELGNSMKWDSEGSGDTWYRLEGRIESARAHIELIKKIN